VSSDVTSPLELADLLRAKLCCAVCSKRVDKVSSFWNGSTMQTDYEVSCHGQTEVVSVPREVFDSMAADFSLVPAFQRPLLGETAMTRGTTRAREDR